MHLWPGEPHPLGATYDGHGTNFSVFSNVAERIELCLFDEYGHEARFDLPEVTTHCWHGYAPGIGPGQAYGFRVHGPYRPSDGPRCNPAKLLLDPYARAIEGHLDWNDAVFGYAPGAPDGPPDPTDSAPYVPRSLVTSPFFDWGNDRSPATPWHDTVVYELHVRGFTKLHPLVPPEHRGTYLGLAHPAVLEHLESLGVTAVELMPVHHFMHEQQLVARGLRNFWGYNSIGFFAPHAEYRASSIPGDQVREFKHLVKALHEAGLEVILDVVYNHTAEGNHLGPTLSFRGLDNDVYYWLEKEDRRRYRDLSGCGNTMDVSNSRVLQLVMDSLRYWISEMHVDGFRFDLAAALAQHDGPSDRLSTFVELVQQDPVICKAKLIAEPWHVGDNGYRVGDFPGLWTEWNDRYRNSIRDLWRTESGMLPEFAHRFTGSPDLYETSGRRPHASINFVTCHDGFTLHDLVSYERKHNEANGEDNRDGESHNRSWNCGIEGETGDPDIVALRARQKRNFLTTLLLSQGVPMLLAGDEFGRTQYGNNNAYCQDNPTAWIDWEHIDTELFEFVRRLVKFESRHPVFHRRAWFEHRSVLRNGQDLRWFRPDGRQMSQEDWSTPFAKAIAMYLDGRSVPHMDRYGRRVLDDSFYVALNASSTDLPFTLPVELGGSSWRRVIDTVSGIIDRDGLEVVPESTFQLTAHSMWVLQRNERD